MTNVAESFALRVAILSDSDTQRVNLKQLLESSGLRVVENEIVNERSVRRIDDACVDVLLVDLDENSDHDFDFLDELLDSPLPILFNDGHATRMRAAQRRGDWGRNLARKLEDVAREAGTYIPPEQEVVDDAIDEAVASSVENTAVDEASAPAATESGYYAEAQYLDAIIEEQIRESEAELKAEDNAEPSVIPEAEAAVDVWVLGASIGGPQSVKRFLAAIKEPLPVSFVLAQHIGENFVSLLARQLDHITAMNVMSAQEGHLLRHNDVIIAPVNERVAINKHGIIELKPINFESIYSPSIDAVMTDICLRYGTHTGSIMFSGMGNDGVRGSQLIAARGGHVWAQDSDSCVISSMPDSSRRAGIVSFTGTPEELASHVIEHFREQS
ncbi:MAG: chemotaxis protein CheB [Granulosicoccaceae bacterium]